MSASNPQRVLLTFRFPDGSQEQVSVDATVTETHTLTAEISKHKVETGVDVADHIRPLPQTLALEGVINNTPIYTPSTQMGGATGQQTTNDIQVGKQTIKVSTLQFSQRFDRVRDADNVFVAAWKKSALIDATTTLRSYTNMALTSYPVTRTADKGNGLFFTAQLEELVFVDTQSVKTPAAKHKPKKHGNQAPKPAEDKREQARSGLKAIKNFVKGQL